MTEWETFYLEVKVTLPKPVDLLLYEKLENKNIFK